jgi:hypothetical protein
VGRWGERVVARERGGQKVTKRRVGEPLVVSGLAEKMMRCPGGGQEKIPMSFPEDQTTPPCRPMTMTEVEDQVELGRSEWKMWARS